MMDPWIDYNFSIDLVSATQYHYDFLQLVDFVYPQLYIEEVVLKAVKRYERCWMVLKSTHPSKQLIPPIDVHWIWHVHMLSEQSYANDCTKLNSKSSLVDRPFAPLSPEIFQQVEAETRSLWLALFPQEPYDFEMTLGSPLDTEYKQISGMNFVEAIAKQREFNYQVSFPHFKSTQFLKKAAQRYRKFLYLQQKHSEKRLSPTCDIELIWQTHKTHPHAYATDLLANLGSEMFKTISSSTNELAKDTVELWKETFGETLLAPGCLHRSYPSQKGLSCYVPTKRWNDFDAIYSLASVRVERLPTDKEALQVCLFTEDFNGSRTDFGVLKMTRNCGDQFEETRPNLIIRPAVLGAPLHLEITPMAHRGMITSIMGRKKSSVVYRSSCNVRDLLPRSMLGCNNSVTLPIFTTTGDITDAYLKLNSAAKSVAEFDVVFGNFVDTTMTESGTPQLYTQCLHASLNQQWFRANPTASVSDHILNERRTIKSYLCQVVHSAPSVLSAIFIYNSDRADEIVVSAQLVGPENLPDLEDVEKSDKGLLALGPNERAMIIRNKYGDFALIKAQWMKSKTELDHNLEAKIVPGQLVLWVHVLNRSVPDKAIFSMINHQSTLIDLKGAKLNLFDRTIKVESNWVMEQVALVLSAGVLYNLCQPSRITQQPYEMRWPLMLMTGYGGELPSNRYFEYCNQRSEGSNKDSDERSTSSSRSSSGYESIHGAQHYYPMWSTLANFPLLPWSNEVNNYHLNNDTKTHSTPRSSPASVRNGLTINHSEKLGKSLTSDTIETQQ